MKMEVQSTGLRDAASGLDALHESLLERIADAVEIEGMEAADLARCACEALPHATGVLRDSICFVAERDGGTIDARLEATAAYAAYVELGTSTQAARPFLYPAGRRMQERLTARLAGLGGEIHGAD